MKSVGQSYRKYILPIILGPFLKLIEALFDLLIPLFMKAVIDLNQYGSPELIPQSISRSIATFIRIFGIWIKDNVALSDALVGGTIIICMGIIGFIITMCAQYIAADTAVKASNDIRNNLYTHILSLSKKEREEIGEHKLLTTLNSDTYQVQQGILLFIRLIARAPFIILGALVFTFILDYRIGIAFSVIVPLILLIVFLVLGQSKKKYILIQNNLDEISSYTSDTLLGERVIKASNKINESNEEFSKYTSSYYSKSKRVNYINAFINPLTFAVTSLVIIIILFVVKNNLFNSDTSEQILLISTLITCIAYLAQIFFTTVQLTTVLIDLIKASIARRRINEVFIVSSSLRSGQAAINEDYEYILEFDHLSFSYGDKQDTPTLKDISFKLKKGESLGIIGGTGSGKSTIISLLERYYEYKDGDIYLKEKSLHDYPLSIVRNQMSVVLQKSSLFKGSIKDNLCLGKDIAEEDIIKALKDAEAYEFVKAYDDFLLHEVNENGSNFSGGQRQRLCIARALLNNKEILILDDATSALDLLTESKIKFNLKKRNLTEIIISQRVSSLMSCDKIMVLSKGEVVAFANHETLLKESKIYQEIYNSQIKEKDDE